MEEDKCFYCKTNEADKESFYTKEMYKLTGVSEFIIGRSSSFYKKEVKIPRCSSCSKKHSDSFIYLFIPFFIAFVIVISRGLYYNGGGWDWTWAIIVSIIISLFCAALITFIINLLFFKVIFGIHIEEDVDNHPTVAHLVENGWLTSRPNPHNVSKNHIPSDIIARKELMKEMKKKLEQMK